MNIDIISRHGSISSSVETYAREKVEKLDRYLRKIAKVEVILDQNADRFFAEMRLHADLKGTSDVVAHVDHEDPRASIDLLMDKMERQLVRLKERRSARKRDGIRKNDEAVPIDDEGDDLTYEDVINNEFKS